MQEGENNLPANDLPPLRIHHLFVLTTVFAVVMSAWLGIWRLYRFLNSPDLELPEFTAGISLIFFVQTLSQSVCIAVAAFGLAWRKQGVSFPSQPGHWIACYLTISWAYYLVLTVIQLFSEQVFAFDVSAWLGMPMSMIFHCCAIALWFAAYLHESVRIWKWGWVAMACKSLLIILWIFLYVGVKCIELLLEVFWFNTTLDWQPLHPWGPWAMILMLLPQYASLAFLLAASIVDWLKRRRFHWSHLLVVLSTLISTAIVAMYYLSI